MDSGKIEEMTNVLAERLGMSGSRPVSGSNGAGPVPGGISKQPSFKPMANNKVKDGKL